MTAFQNFTPAEKKLLSLYLTAMSGPGRPKIQRKRAARLASKFAPNSTVVNLKPIEKSAIHAVVVKAKEILEDNLKHGVLTIEDKEKHTDAINLLASIGEKLS